MPVAPCKSKHYAEFWKAVLAFKSRTLTIYNPLIEIGKWWIVVMIVDDDYPLVNVGGKGGDRTHAPGLPDLSV